MFTKKYFQDRPILFLNLIVLFGAAINVIAIVLRINTSQSLVIVRYQLALGLAGFQRGSVSQLYTFAIAAMLFAAVGVVMGARLYFLKRYLSILILSLTVVILLFNLIVSASILNLQ